MLAGRERVWPHENGARPVRSEFIDRLGATGGWIKIARAVESQAQVCCPIVRNAGNGAEDDPLSARCKLKDSAGCCGTRICAHAIDIARIVYGKAFKEKLSGAAEGGSLITEVEF